MIDQLKLKFDEKHSQMHHHFLASQDAIDRAIFLKLQCLMNIGTADINLTPQEQYALNNDIQKRLTDLIHEKSLALKQKTDYNLNEDVMFTPVGGS